MLQCRAPEYQASRKTGARKRRPTFRPRAVWRILNLSDGGSFLLPSLPSLPDDKKTLLAARLLVSLPHGSGRQLFSPE